MKRDYQEEDLYKFIEEYFTNMGFKVHGEVHSCDVAAVKDDILVILELKKSLSMELLIQAVKRQKLGDLTYMVVPKPKNFSMNKKFNDTLYLLKRLTLGLIFVDVEKNTVENILDPQEFDLAKSRRLNQKKRDKLLQEIRGRQTSLNKGGSRGKKLMTSYREDSIKVLYLASINELISPNLAVKAGVKKAPSILRDNYYNWFVKIERGKYSITDAGVKALEDYKDILDVVIKDIIIVQEH